MCTNPSITRNLLNHIQADKTAWMVDVIMSVSDHRSVVDWQFKLKKRACLGSRELAERLDFGDIGCFVEAVLAQHKCCALRTLERHFFEFTEHFAGHMHLRI